MSAEQREYLDELMSSAPPRKAKPKATRKIVDGELETKLVEVEPVEELTGEFTALVSDFEWDRQGERFDRNAFDNAVAKVRAESRAVPVLYGHDQASTDSIVGHVPPDGWEITDEGLMAKGVIDVTNPVGHRIYRMLQKGVLSWSIGFSVKRRGSRRNRQQVLEEVGEMYELSIVPVPANDRTRTLVLKDADEGPPTDGEQRRRFEELVGKPLSHAELHTRLVEAGIVARPITDARPYFNRVDENGDSGAMEEKAAQSVHIARFDA